MDTLEQNKYILKVDIKKYFPSIDKTELLKRIRIMNPYIKTLIEANKDAVDKVIVLEKTVAAYPVVDEKSKVNYGNLCIALKGYRMVAEATECMLINENVLKGKDGKYYEEVKDEVPAPEAPAEGKGQEGTQQNQE